MMNVQHQKGAVLLVCLIMLLILTVIGAAAVSESTLQERMAGGARDYNVAFQAAEASLRAGEAHAKNQVLASADPTKLFINKTNCPALDNAQWTPPGNLAKKPTQPTCAVTNHFGNAAGATSFICETDGSIAENRAFDCLNRTYLYNVEATGFGSGEVTVRLRSTYSVLVPSQN